MSRFTVVPCFGLLVAGLSPRRPGFITRPIYVGCLLATVTMEQVFVDLWLQ